MKVESASASSIAAKKTDKKPEAKTDSKVSVKKDPRAKANAEAAARRTELKEAKAAKAALALEKSQRSAPAVEDAVEVSITAREPTPEEKAQQKGYTPKEVRSKAKAFLQMGNLPPEQRAALETALNSEEDAEKAAIKKRIKDAKG